METTMQMIEGAQVIAPAITQIETATTESVEAQLYVSVRFKAFRQKNKQGDISYKRVVLEYSKQVRFTYSLIEYLKELALYLQRCNKDGITLFDKSFSVYVSETTRAMTLPFIDDVFQMQMEILKSVVLLHGNESTLKDDLIAGRPQSTTALVCRNIAQSFIGRQREIDILKLVASIQAQQDFGNKVYKDAIATAKSETLTKKQQVVLQQIGIRAKERRIDLKEYKVLAIRGISLLAARKVTESQED